MARLKDIAVAVKDVFMLDPRLLKERPGWNVRNYEDPETIAHIEHLSLSIAENGVRQPILIVKEGDDIFVDQGHCRRRATMLAIERGADIKAVPCMHADRYASELDRLKDMVNTNEGKGLTPLERAEVYARMIKLGETVDGVAKSFGYSTKHVDDMLKLRSIGGEVVEQVRAGNITATTAVEVIKTHGKEAAPQIVKQAVATAKAQGKEKATPKHVKQVAPKKPERTKVTVTGNGSEATVTGPGGEMVAEIIRKALMANALGAVKVEVK